MNSSNNIPLKWHSTASFGGHFNYPYAHLYQLNVEDFVVEIDHGDFLYFPFCLNSAKQQKTSFQAVHRVVRDNNNNTALTTTHNNSGGGKGKNNGRGSVGRPNHALSSIMNCLLPTEPIMP